MIKGGVASPNCNYIGVYPLSLAVEGGDVDMAAVLLTAGADCTLRPNGPQAKDALGLATSMRDDPKCKYRHEAAVILEMMNDKEALEVRFEKVKLKIQKEKEASLVFIGRLMVVAIPLMVTAFVYLMFFR